MARAACEGSDVVVATTDNPRTEAPEDILDDLRPGLTGDARVVVDRREAIAAAISRAREGDIVLIAGKGHESFQEIRGERIDFDDRLVAREFLT